MLNLIKRNTPKITDNFVIKNIPADNGYDTYEIHSEDNKIVLAGNNNSSLAMAYYRYLKEYCNVVIINGDYDISDIASTPLPEEKIKFTVYQKIRARMSFESFSLEGNFWGFDRWEKEIDFMAMNGINTALQLVGFDSVIYRTLTEIGMDSKLCLEFSGGPAFLSRQITGNIAGTNSVNSLDYLKRKAAVGKMITEREKELGITPVFPAAMPSVPFSLRKKYVKMDIFKAPLWYNFPPIFYIKPQNAFFEIFNKKFLQYQREMLGETDSYFFEPLYDVEQKGYNSYLAHLGKALSDTLGAFNDNAVCYIHLSSINGDFFKDVSSRKFIIINDTDDLPEYIKGKNHLVSIKGNKYGRTAIYGDIGKVSECPYSKENNPALLGTSLELDTFRENPMYCAAALNAAIVSKPFDADKFLNEFLSKRYRTDAFTKDFLALKKLCCNNDEPAGSIICARPFSVLKHTAPYDTVERKYDFHELYKIADSILKNDARKNEYLRADIQSVVRQLLSELAYPVYLAATEFFFEGSVGNFEQASNLFIEICEDTDRILKTRAETNLFTKIDEARTLGGTKDEKQELEINFLMLHTIWGPVDHSVLYDSVWREWGGLIKDYYTQRWFMYFRSLAAYFKSPKKLRDNSKKQILDRNEYKGSYQAKRLALFDNNFLEDYIPRKDGIEEEDTLEVAKELLHKYSEIIKQF